MNKLVCLADKWKDHDSKEISEAGPKKGEIVTYINERCYSGAIYLLLKGYEDWYNKKDFRPLTPLEAWNLDEQSSYLDWIEQLSPGVETVEK